ncbi:MAG: glycosyltransferase family 39 protein [Bacteroidales bacterium]|jgi:4-amino-4-deoxy-L-arabinose transferase|nr:glycosyltransferase family 39 protein [Bacteroidales bacterium]
MENLYPGIITILICIAGYALAFRQYSRDNLQATLILIMVCGLLLRLYAASDFYLHAWDERYHALVAKNMITHPFRPMLYSDPVLPYDFRNWVGNHVWIHKQPVPLWSMAFSMSVFGVNEIALRLPSVILTTLGIGITFYVAKYLFNQRVGIIAAFLYSIHGLIIELSAGRVATDHIDVFFLFFVQLSVLLAIRYVQSKRLVFNVLCGVSIGMAILSKWLPALIVLPIWLLLALDSKKLSRKEIIIDFLLLIAVIAIVSVPWQWYIYSHFPQEARWESSFNLKHITEGLENHGQPFYYHFEKVMVLYGEIIYLPLLWFFYKSFKHLKKYRRLVLTLWILIPLLFFSIARTKMQAYTIFAAPAFFIVSALFWEYLFRYRHRLKYKALTIAILFLLLALPVRYSIERVKPFIIRERNPQWTKELKELDKQLPDYRNVVVFNARYPIETMFYTDCMAYETIPDSAALMGLDQRGYSIFIREETDKGSGNRGDGESDILLTGYNVKYCKWSGK